MKWLILVLLPLGTMDCSSSSSTPSAKNLGTVALDSQSYLSGGQKYGSGSISANFLRAQVDPYLGCQKKTLGACIVHYACQPVLTQPVDDAGLTPYASAGEVDVAGLPTSATPIALTVMTGGMFPGQYGAYEQFTPLFAGGESVSVTAAGDAVKAFTAMVTMPLQPTISAPDANAPATVGHGQDLPFAWSGGGSGDLHVSVAQTSTSGTPGIDCFWPAADGAGNIPSAALSLFAVGSVSLSLSVLSSSMLTVGDWQIEVVASTGPLQPSGASYQSSSATLQ